MTDIYNFDAADRSAEWHLHERLMCERASFVNQDDDWIAIDYSLPLAPQPKRRTLKEICDEAYNEVAAIQNARNH